MVVQIAQKHEFPMHGILALASLHCAHLDEPSRRDYTIMTSNTVISGGYRQPEQCKLLRRIDIQPRSRSLLLRRGATGREPLPGDE